MRTPNPLSLAPDTRIFLCRMNVSRNARRQMRFGDQKVIIVSMIREDINSDHPF